jgi:hypothetical protein
MVEKVANVASQTLPFSMPDEKLHPQDVMCI